MTTDDMEALTRDMIDCRTATVTTDEYSGYNTLNKFVAHNRVNHSVAYVEYDLFGAKHTNAIESFWAILKRAIFGQFHHVSRKYLALYLREIAFRYNLRRVGGGLDSVLHLAIKP